MYPITTIGEVGPALSLGDKAKQIVADAKSQKTTLAVGLVAGLIVGALLSRKGKKR